jgi:DNA-binding response OmpR family regulator
LAQSDTADEEPEEAPAGRRGKARRVLLVEDDVQVGAAASCLLGELGHEALIASSAAAALAIASTSPGISLVLLDRALPGEPGDAAISGLRQRLPGVPIVFFTGEDVDDIARARVDAVLSKPVARAELSTLFEALDRGASLRSQGSRRPGGTRT